MLLRTLRPISTLSSVGQRALTPLSTRYASNSTITPVDLEFDVTEPKERKVTDQNLVICHGLFGSKQNWRSLAKAFAQRLGMNVYTLDLRNHGVSPSASPHNYEAMAADIAHFINSQGLGDTGINLVGHSMGGKAVMSFALNSELNKPLRTLTSVDMAPVKGKVSPDFETYIESMKAVDEAQVGSRSEADKILAKVEANPGIRQFLLTNLRSDKDESGKSIMRFRVPLQLLGDAIPSIGDFPYTPPPPVSATSPQWTGPTVFIKGAKSKYINSRNIPVCEAFFPNATIETLDAGHWVHSEKPLEVVEIVAKLVQGAK